MGLINIVCCELTRRGHFTALENSVCKYYEKRCKYYVQAHVFSGYIFGTVLPLMDSTVEREVQEMGRQTGGMTCRKEPLDAEFELGPSAVRTVASYMGRQLYLLSKTPPCGGQILILSHHQKHQHSS